MSRVAQFAIGAGDPERAITFYRGVFGWSFRKWDGPQDYWLVDTGSDDAPGIKGSLSRRQEPGGYISTVAVPSVDHFAERVRAYGGAVIAPKAAVPGVGYLAYCKDTEENLFGIMEFDRNAGVADQSHAA